MTKQKMIELCNMPSPNGLTARNIRRLAKKNKLNKQTVLYNCDAKSRIPGTMATQLGYTPDDI